MKSKKANEFFADERVAFRTGGTYYVVEVDARKAVELAEDDARERAIEAFKRYITKNSISSILLSDKILMDVAMNEFKEKYDNEE